MMILKTIKTWFFFLSVIIILPFLNLPCPVYAMPPNKIIETSFIRDATGETVFILLEAPPQFKYYALPNPERIVVDVYNAFFPGVRQTKAINGQTIQAIRMGQNTKNRTRIVLDMKQKQTFTIEPSNAIQGKGHLLVIKVASATEPFKPSIKNQENRVTSDSKSSKLYKTPDNHLETIEKNVTQDIQDNPQKTREGSTSSFKPDFPPDLPASLFDMEQSPSEKASNFPLSLSGYIQARAAMDSVDNPKKEHNTAFKNRALIETKYKKRITVSALSDFLYFGEENFQKDYDLELYEAYVTLPVNRLTLTLGKKILRWGKTDQISPVDTLNPEDFREFIVPEYEDRKIPVWMADLVVKFNGFSLEGVYMPKFEPARQDYFGTDWSVFSHIKEEIQASALPDPVKTYVNNINVNKTRPDDNGLNGEFAIRATTAINGWDLGMTYHHAWEDLPFYSNFPIKNFHTNGTMDGDTLASTLSTAVLTNENIEIEYPRINILGFEFETTLGDFGIRGEAAWQDKQSYLTSDFTSEQSPTLFYIIGADYSGVDWYVNLQLSHSHIFDHGDDFLYFKQDTVSLLGEISKKLDSEWLKASLHYSITLNDNEYYLSPRLTYTYITNLDLTLGAHIFEGDSTTFIGRFDHNDQFFLDVIYHF